MLWAPSARSAARRKCVKGFKCVKDVKCVKSLKCAKVTSTEMRLRKARDDGATGAKRLRELHSWTPRRAFPCLYIVNML